MNQKGGKVQRIAAVVLAAGKGTRMKSDRVKVLHPICGRPLAWFPVRAALALDCSPVVLVVGHQADRVEAEFSALFPRAPLRFAEQKEQLGTGHAVMAARRALRDAGLEDTDGVLILYGDTPLVTAETLQRLVHAKRESGAPLAFVTTLPAEPHGYGRIVRNAKGLPERIVEEKDASAEERKIGEINAGIYLADAGFLFGTLERATPDNRQGEYYLTDVVAAASALAREGRAPWPATADATEEEVSGVNDRAQLAWNAARLRERRLTALMREGVSIVDPAVTYVDEGVEVGADTVLEPLVSLRGKTRVGRNVRIGQGCVLIDVEVEDFVTILPYSHLESAKLGKGAIVGPFARLRPGADIGDEAHVGNFVELKKTTLGKGSKANHLSYLGDAVIGEGVNVGAGTITCNYDGKKKHVTTIEDGAFIGSDTQLVAPVTVHKGAYVGTGTTVREDVPAGSLAVSAGKQRNIEGWVEKKKK
ncbi:MAG TPA: bifunctional UDP-N-acetylglucosamine diphosphorylase/glucosamine-1-phosphate N-acetyltransferase GlmU [Myxococcales bacterium]|nr:bifunctional UDP-N-acetylglucosamine diphosphorylase/glucosamine-1-phosphate N-acetyltransferase GlmU [Myxococcales bacterium]